MFFLPSTSTSQCFWLTVSDDSTHGFEEYRNLKELAARGAHIAVIGAGYVGVTCKKWVTSDSSHRSTSGNVHKTRAIGTDKPSCGKDVTL